MNKPDFLKTAKKALKKFYPNCECAFVAGSMLRGEESATSDIDVVVIYGDEFEGIHRNSIIENGWSIEFFVHNRQSLDYYMNLDRQCGMCIIMDMVVSGLVIPEANDFTRERKAKAQKFIDAGPPILSDMEIEDRR